MSRRDSTGSDPRPAAGGYVPLGRFAGIPARAHWTLLLVLAVLTQLLALSVLPSALPDRHPIGYWLVAAGAAVTFLAAILAHEFAHALTARRYGVATKHVTLWLLGGVTEFDRDPSSPRAEAAIAASGPATSLALGGAFAGLTWMFAGPGLLAVALAWLAGVNLLLGVFNLLPGAPLDGGRILRAVLWGHHHDRMRAAQTSARVGSALGMIIVAFGVLQVISGAIFGLWLILIGWFLISAATAERHAAGGSRLAGRVARDLMRTPPMVAPSWWTVSAFVEQLRSGVLAAHGRQLFAMVDWDGSPVGLIALRDLQRVRADERDTTRLRDATRLRIRPLTVSPDTPLPDLLGSIHMRGGIAVVVENGQVVGTIDHADLTNAATLAALDPEAARPDPTRNASTHVDRFAA